MISIVYDESEIDNEDDYKQQISSKFSEVIHKQDSSDLKQPEERITAEINSGSQVLEQEAFETAPGTGSSQPLRNHGTERDPYTPLDVFLVPATNISADVSGINYES